MAQMDRPIWEVIGGEDSGGILVRVGQGTKSDQAQMRLSHGAYVEELQLVGERLNYRCIRGSGPHTGWVSIKLPKKDLLVKRGGSALTEEEQELVAAAVAKEAGKSLEVTQQVIPREAEGPLRAIVRSHSERAPCAVVMCAGNPGKDFGAAHCGNRLFLAIDEALGQIGVPVVRFDYSGVGISAPNGGSDDPSNWTLNMDAYPMEIKSVVTWARRKLSDNIITVGYSFGCCTSLPVGVMGLTRAHVSVSIGYNVTKMMPPELGDGTAMALESHSKLACPVLYIVGERDRMSPMDQTERLIKARADGGQLAQIEVVKQEKTMKSGQAHAFEGQENDVGQICSAYVAALRAEILQAETLIESLAPVA